MVGRWYMHHWGLEGITSLAIFRFIAEACNGLDVQLVISLGGRLDPEMLDGLPGQPLVVREAPQLELLKKAEIVITHGGVNTVLETLIEGKPMIVIPIAHDQPAVAARLAWLNVAEVLSAESLSAKQISSALVNLLSNPSYRDTARDLQARIRSARGLERAAEVIEEAIEKYALSRGTGLNGRKFGLKMHIGMNPRNYCAFAE